MADPAPEREGMGAIVDRLKKLEAKVKRLEAASGTQRARAVAKLTSPGIGFDNEEGFGLAGPLYVQFNIPVPEDMDYVSIAIFGHVEVLDSVSAGLAVAQAYLEVGGDDLIWSVGPFSASKDAGASVVNNIIGPVTGFGHAVTPGTSLLVSMNVTGTNPSAFPIDPANFATLLAFAIFSKSQEETP